jgi:hypothetical protein
MIRIDEIYNNTFWPWVERNLPGTRLFFCDPPGHTDPSALFNLGSDDAVENRYIFMHDQEPVDLDLFKKLFEEVVIRNYDIVDRLKPGDPIVWPDATVQREYMQMITQRSQDYDGFLRQHQDLFQQVLAHNPDIFDLGDVIVSERGEHVEALAQRYGWRTHYYFYHGWACLDWFRGYNRTFLIDRARDRRPTKTFMSPNRIVGGRRDHRVLFLYNIFRAGLAHNHISAPRTCPAEAVDIVSIAQKYTNVYQDIVTVFEQADLPRMFAGEHTQQMTSCWLGNFAEAADSLVYVATETVYFGRRLHLTEKTFKAIALEMPFVLVAPAGSLAYLREYGFQTFGDIWDESYDEETDDVRRIERVTQLLKDLESMGPRERERIHRQCLSVVEHNYNHFYGEAFAQILWSEFETMLKGLDV